MSKNYENMSNEEIKEQLEWSDHHEFSYNYAIWAFEEIDRLNNIIDELEKWFNECIDNRIIAREHGYNTISDTFFEMVLDKLKALKENNKDV